MIGLKLTVASGGSVALNLKPLIFVVFDKNGKI